MRVIDVFINEQRVPRDQWFWADGVLTIRGEACGHVGRFTLSFAGEEVPTATWSWLVPGARPDEEG